jgi:hypothetical protein
MRRVFAIAALVVSAGVAGQAQAQDFDLMQFADTNADGKVTAEEYTNFSEQGWGFFAQGAEQVKVADLDPMAKGAFTGITPDANGVVTHAVYTAAVPGRFKAADKNGDGTLDSAELNGTVKPPA